MNESQETSTSTPEMGLTDTIESMLSQMNAQDRTEEVNEAQESDTGNAEEEETAEAAPSDSDTDPAEEDPGASDVDEDGLPTDPTELRRGFLRNADYTRKTQALSKQSKQLLADLKEVEELKAQYTELLAQAKGAPQSTAAGQSDDFDDLPENATAEQVVEHIVNKRVQAALDEALKGKLSHLTPDLEQAQFTESIVEAYAEFVDADGTDPIFGTKSVAEAVGNVIESNPELGDLAKTDPLRAVKLAASMVDVKAPKKAGNRAAAKKAAKAASSVRSKNGKAVSGPKSLLDVTRAAMVKHGIAT